MLFTEKKVSEVEKTHNCVIFLLVNIDNWSRRPKHHTRVKTVVCIHKLIDIRHFKRKLGK